MTAADFARILPDVAKRLCADRPMIERGDTLRFGTHGSLVVHVAGPRRGTWTDFEAGASGGTLKLIEHVLQVARAGALRWLEGAGARAGAWRIRDAAKRRRTARRASAPKSRRIRPMNWERRSTI